MVIYKVQPPAPPPKLALRPVPQRQQQIARPVAMRPAIAAGGAPLAIMQPQQPATQKAIVLRPVQNQGGIVGGGGAQPILLQNGQQPMYISRGVFNKPMMAGGGGSRYGTLKSM